MCTKEGAIIPKQEKTIMAGSTIQCMYTICSSTVFVGYDVDYASRFNC